MTPNKRIFLNIIATYGRTLLGVLCGLFTTRWVLMALGQENFGLFGLIGSIVIIASFINIQFASALSRFYAVSIGVAQVSVDKNQAIEECRKWFTIGVAIHTVIPTLLVVIAYPLGARIIESGLIGVPIHKTEECIWLWRFVVISSFVGMVNVPFSAMYTAKQYIAELTVYSIVQVLARLGFVYYMTTSPRDWLVGYGLATCLIAIAPQVLICIRAMIVFEECRLRLSYLRNLNYYREIGMYALWQTIGGLSYILRNQIPVVMTGRSFGPRTVASYSVGTTVAGEAGTLAGALNGAFAPAIATAYGAGDLERVRVMVLASCKFGVLLTLLFAIPIGLEIKMILSIWLKEVPTQAEGICILLLLVAVVGKFAMGYVMGVNATGRVAKFQIFHFLSSLTIIPITAILLTAMHNVYSLIGATLATTFFVCLSDVVLAKPLLHTSVREWFVKIVFPISAIAMTTSCIGCVPVVLLEASLCRMVTTTLLSVLFFVLMSWNFALTKYERQFIVTKVRTVLSRLGAR